MNRKTETKIECWSPLGTAIHNANIVVNHPAKEGWTQWKLKKWFTTTHDKVNNQYVLTFVRKEIKQKKAKTE